jgi:hypothetical protein
MMTSTNSDDDTLKALRRLERKLPEPAEGVGLLMLAGNGLAQSLVNLRARQTHLEAVRAETRRTPVREARAAEAEFAAAALTTVRSDVRRLSVKEPERGEGMASVYGHVLRDGDPVPGALVALVDDDQRLVCIDTDDGGGFALSVASESPLALEVAVEGKVVHRDPEATIAPAPVTPYRLVELGEAQPQRPSQRPCDGEPAPDRDEKPEEPKKPQEPEEPVPGDDEPVPGDDEPVPDKEPRRRKPSVEKGATLTRALQQLRSGGHAVSVVRLRASDDSTPKVSRLSETDDGIELEVGGRVTDSGRLSVLAPLLAHDPGASSLGITSGTAAAGLLRKGGVTSWEEAEKVIRISSRSVARRFGLKPKQGEELLHAMAATLAKIVVED